MKGKQEITIKVNVKLSLWSAIKLRIAGINNIKKAIEYQNGCKK